MSGNFWTGMTNQIMERNSYWVRLLNHTNVILKGVIRNSIWEKELESFFDNEYHSTINTTFSSLVNSESHEIDNRILYKNALSETPAIIKKLVITVSNARKLTKDFESRLSGLQNYNKIVIVLETIFRQSFRESSNNLFPLPVRKLFLM